jgi:hypothetical protein
LFCYHFGESPPPAELLQEMLALLEGHPLAITWAASLLGIEGHDGIALSPIFEKLGGRISYGKLKLFLAFEQVLAAKA